MKKPTKRRGRPPGSKNIKLNKSPAINSTPETLMVLSFAVDMNNAKEIMEFLKTKNIFTFQLEIHPSY